MIRVLIADDSPELRSRLVELVSDIDGVRVVGQASDGNEVLEAVAETDFDVLVLDVKMPEMNGIEVLKHLQDSPRRPETIVALTAFPYPQYRRRCLELGAEYFLDKASEFELLVTLLEEYAQQETGADNT